MRFEVRTASVAPEEYVPSWWKGEEEAATQANAARMLLGGRRTSDGLVTSA